MLLQHLGLRYPALPEASGGVNAVVLFLMVFGAVMLIRMILLAPYWIAKEQAIKLEGEAQAHRLHEERERNADRRAAEQAANEARIAEAQLESDRKTRNLHRQTERRKSGVSGWLPPKDEQ